MYRFGVALLLTVTMVGCESGFGRHCRVSDDSCADVCPNKPTCPAPSQTVTAPPAHVEVQTPETVVVKAPQQKIVVETPAPPAVPVQQQAPTGMALTSNGMPAQSMGFGMPGRVDGQHADRTSDRPGHLQRTRLGFMFDTFNIPIPFIRPIPITQPFEAHHVQMGLTPMAQPGGFAVPMTGGFAAMPTGGVQMAPVTVTGMALANGQMIVPNQGLALQNQGQGFALQNQQGFALQNQGLSLQPGNAGGFGLNGGGQQNPSGGASGLSAQDRLKNTEKQVEELEKLCEELKRLREQQKQQEQKPPAVTACGSEGLCEETVMKETAVRQITRVIWRTAVKC